MSKMKDDTGTPGSEKLEKIPSVEVKTNNTLVQENYPAEQYLSWFMIDAQNVQSWAGGLFKGGFDNTDPRMMDLKQAAENALKEVETDIAKLKEFLALYVPPNN